MQVDYKKVGKNYHFFQLMILYGEMVCGIECGRWEYKVSYSM